MEFTFALTYELDDRYADVDDLVERLAAAGCDDALVGIGRPGRIALEFVRDAETLEVALMNARADVERAIPSAKPIRMAA